MKKIERKTIEVQAVFDIETHDWTEFRCGGILDTNGKYYQSCNEIDFFDHLIDLPAGPTVWSHNGGRFDMLALVNHLLRRKIAIKDPLVVGGSLIAFTAAGKDFRDSFRLFQMGLSDAAKIGGGEKSSIKDECVCGEDGCEGFCALASPSRKLMKKVLSYNENDCRVLLRAILALKNLGEEYDLDLRNTLASSSAATFKRLHGIEDATKYWDRHPECLPFAREGVYGGYVKVFRPYAARGHQYDINSAYASAMVSLNLPVGPCKLVTDQASRRAYNSEKPGIYQAKVEVPLDMYIPPLPFRHKHLHRLVSPVGSFSTWAPLPELQNAEKLGVKVTVVGAVTWNESAKVTKNYCQRIWDIRNTYIKSHGKKHPLAIFFKTFANALYGKFVEDDQKSEVFIGLERPPGNDWEGLCNGAYDEPVVFTRPKHYIPKMGYPHWGAYITSNVRIKLITQLYGADQGESAVYCDTDSCFSLTERTANIGPELGQWSEEGDFEEFMGVAPKIYKVSRNGKTQYKAKGFPKIEDESKFARLIAGEPLVEERGVHGILTAARKGKNMFIKKRIERRLRPNGGLFGDRREKDGKTYPLHIDECLEMAHHNRRDFFEGIKK